MKVKRVKIGIKSLKDFLEDAKETMKKVETGEKVKHEKGLYFESIEGFRKALTPKRLELLHIIKEKQPESLQELSRLAKRDMKRKREGRRESIPMVDYERIDLQIAV